MKPSSVCRDMTNVPSDEEVICVWFTREDFPVGITDDGESEYLALSEWNEVVSTFERTKWDNPLTSSWTDVHQDIYRLVGDKLNAYA